MRDAMRSLAGFLGERRRWVVGAWVLIVVLAAPFAMKQTDHLTGGGVRHGDGVSPDAPDRAP